MRPVLQSIRATQPQNLEWQPEEPLCASLRSTSPPAGGESASTDPEIASVGAQPYRGPRLAAPKSQRRKIRFGRRPRHRQMAYLNCERAGLVQVIHAPETPIT